MEICTTNPIDPAAIYDLISRQNVGSVLVHAALVKPLASPRGITTCVDYAACDDTRLELRAIAEILTDRFNLEEVILVRRTGRIPMGEIISLVAVSSPSSQDAFEACKQGLASMKAMKTVVKDEIIACF